ncbi:MAG: hypothetical protein HY253_09615 [Burkholderiales bacterium]|nr:hypothetical protein [Burkholderiales bacterium]
MYVPLSTKKNVERFEEYDFIYEQLTKICRNWETHLRQYLSKTEALFGKPEVPWLANERVVVSSLAASIIRSNPQSIVAEELPIKKATQSEFGRCDLWAHIPSSDAASEFNFYLEAKKFLQPKDPRKINEVLSSERGIRRMFADYVKSQGKLTQRSVFSSLDDRKHSHYVVGMICMPLQVITESDLAQEPIKSEELEKLFNEAFTGRKSLDNGKSRLMEKFPTVGFYFKPERVDLFPAMLVSFTVLGRSLSS